MSYQHSIGWVGKRKKGKEEEIHGRGSLPNLGEGSRHGEIGGNNHNNAVVLITTGIATAVSITTTIKYKYKGTNLS